MEKLRLHGHEAFFAGGWVRDYLLRKKPKDVDIATSARPDEVMRLFPNTRAIGAQFGVVQVRMYGHAYEVATFRSDHEYLDGRHPSSVSFSGPEQDALRRDFTINGLFYDPVADRLIDFVRGRNDLQNRLIRTIGDPGARFSEDKLRMLRAVRLASCLDFEIVPETWDAIRKLAPEILSVSWERIRDELLKLLTGPAPAAGIDLLHESRLLGHILPEVEAMRGVPNMGASGDADVFAHTRTALSLLRNPSPCLALATLLHDVGKPSSYSVDAQACFAGHARLGGRISEQICRRLKMSREEAGRITDLVEEHLDFEQAKGLKESALRRLLGKPYIAEHLELHRVNLLSSRRDLEVHTYCVQKLEQYRHEPAPAPFITGEDLIGLGYQPGPIFKEMLRTIEDLQLDGIVRSREEALEYLSRSYPPVGTAES